MNSWDPLKTRLDLGHNPRFCVTMISTFHKHREIYQPDSLHNGAIHLESPLPSHPVRILRRDGSYAIRVNSIHLHCPIYAMSSTIGSGQSQVITNIAFGAATIGISILGLGLGLREGRRAWNLWHEYRRQHSIAPGSHHCALGALYSTYAPCRRRAWLAMFTSYIKRSPTPFD